MEPAKNMPEDLREDVERITPEAVEALFDNAARKLGISREEYDAWLDREIQKGLDSPSRPFNREALEEAHREAKRRVSERRRHG